MMDVGPYGPYKKKMQKYIRSGRKKIPDNVKNKAAAVRECVIDASLKSYIESTYPETIRSAFKNVGIHVTGSDLKLEPNAVLKRTNNPESMTTPLTPPRPSSLEYLELTSPRCLKFIEKIKHCDDAVKVATIKDFADLKHTESMDEFEKQKASNELPWVEGVSYYILMIQLLTWTMIQKGHKLFQ